MLLDFDAAFPEQAGCAPEHNHLAEVLDLPVMS